jgi:HAD superfamily hydrolase (TIGR01490 family)
MTRLAVFDLDHTLLDGDSDYLWGRYLVTHGLVDGDHYERTNRQYFEDYKAGCLDIDAFCRFALAPLAAHDLKQLRTLRDRFVAEEIEPIVAAGTPMLLERHRAEGDTLLITTATNRFVTEPIAALLGVEHLIATDPEFTGGRYTGAVAGIPNFRERKVTRLQAWRDAQSVRFDSVSCYSDSHNDLALLASADRAVAVDPDPLLRAEADRRGWPVISLRTMSGLGVVG